jgi:membrane protease YdiL (CAAX protease family)
VDPGGPARPGSLPTGPHPVAGPTTITMPRWPGITLAVGGGVLAIVALTTAELIARGDVDGNLALFGWLAIFGAGAFLAGLLYVALRQLRVRSYLPPERYRGPAVLILTLLVLAVALLLTLPFGADATAIVLGEGELTLLGSIVLLVSSQVGMLLVSWLLVLRPRALAGLPLPPGTNPWAALLSGVGWGVLATIGASLVAGAVALVFESLGIRLPAQTAEQAIGLVEPWLAVLAIVILAPIAEEIFFRGVVFNALLREGGRRWAYLGSAALFAVIHLEPISILPLFLLGLALAWVYERSRNLLAPMAMHATVNGIAVALVLLQTFDVIRPPT